MRCASIGSGSKGNALLVEYSGTTLLIDCGFSYTQLEEGARRLNKSLDEIDAVFITHEHGDHIRGLKTFAKRNGAPIYMSYGTAEASKNTHLKQLNILADNASVNIGSLAVQPVTVPHDSREPFQFIVRHNIGNRQSAANDGAKAEAQSLGESQGQYQGKALGVLTDLGSVPYHVQSLYSECDALVIEANHDEYMLKTGNYPHALKKRVGGDWGHLSNRQTAEFLAKVDQQRLQWMVVAHISEQNNCRDLLKRELDNQVQDPSKIVYACQNEGFAWLAID